MVFSSLDQTEMVRDSRYKLVLRNSGSGPNELYDLQTDAAETTNAFDDPRYATIKTALTDEIAKRKLACRA